MRIRVEGGQATTTTLLRPENNHIWSSNPGVLLVIHTLKLNCQGGLNTEVRGESSSIIWGNVDKDFCIFRPF